MSRPTRLAAAALCVVLSAVPARAAFEAALGLPPLGTYDVRAIETVEEGGEIRVTTLTATARPPLRPTGPWNARGLAASRRVETPRGPIERDVAAPEFGPLAKALLAGAPPRRVVDGTAVYTVPLDAIAGGGAGQSIALTPSAVANREGRRQLDTAAHGRVTVNMMGVALIVDYRANVSLDIATGVPARGELAWHGTRAGERLFSRREIVTFSRR